MKRKTLLLVGGGSGGHIVPILNIYNSVKQHHPEINLVVVGGDGAIDRKLFANLDGFIAIKTGKLHRAITLNNIAQFFYLLKGLCSSYGILKKHRPDLIFSKAGYIAFPIIFWAKILKIPYFVHESDMVMGFANRFAASGADKIFVGFPEDNYPKKYQGKLQFVGQIIAPDNNGKGMLDYDFGFDSKKPIIFITGGSQGSRNINNAIFDALDQLLDSYNLIHHTGSLDYEKAIEIRSKLENQKKQSYFISPLLTKTTGGVDMVKSAISQSSLVITRSSANAMSEISLFKKAIITIPYKYAASDHQTKNAIFYKKAKAALVIADDELSGTIILKSIQHLFSRPNEMKEMGENAYGALPQNGCAKITEEIIATLKRKYEEI